MTNGLLLPSVVPGELPLYIDSSMLSAWRACRRKFFWSAIRALYPMGKSVHLIAGAALASGMEAIRRRCFEPDGAVGMSIEDLLAIAYRPFMLEWGDFEPNPAAKSAKTKENTFYALECYVRQFDPRTDVVQPYRRADGSPAVEYTFSIPLPVLHPSGAPFLFVGRFDLLGMYEQLPVIVDEKTTAAFTMGWADSWNLRGQFMGYLWACQQHGLNIHHAIVRGIAIQKTQIKFETAMVKFPDFMIQRWYEQMVRDVQQIVTAYQNVKESNMPPEFETQASFPYNFADSCTSYGGCAFADLCTAKDAEPWMSNYMIHRWDPLAKQPVKEISNA